VTTALLPPSLSRNLWVQNANEVLALLFLSKPSTVAARTSSTSSSPSGLKVEIVDINELGLFSVSSKDYVRRCDESRSSKNGAHSTCHHEYEERYQSCCVRPFFLSYYRIY
jgi:hypothetical protein